MVKYERRHDLQWLKGARAISEKSRKWKIQNTCTIHIGGMSTEVTPTHLPNWLPVGAKAMC